MEQNNLYRRDQCGHISANLDELPARVLRGRSDFARVELDARIEPYLIQAGFWHASQIPFYEYDNAMLSAFVERWRPETHTFHLPVGECTVTLQDVSHQLGLRVDGDPVSGCTGRWVDHIGEDIWALCQRLLGAVPSEEYRSRYKNTLSMSWLRNVVYQLGPQETEARIMQSARAYILMLIGGVLLADKSSARVHVRYLPLLEDFAYCGRLSWGSAVLSVLYRGLSRACGMHTTDLAGCLNLLQSWIWFRIPKLRPRLDAAISFPLTRRWHGCRCPPDSAETRIQMFRMRIDLLTHADFIWTPYDNQEVLHVTPEWVYEES